MLATCFLNKDFSAGGGSTTETALFWPILGGGCLSLKNGVLHMMIQVIAGASIIKYCISCIETQAKLYNKLSFPILPETVVVTIQ